MGALSIIVFIAVVVNYYRIPRTNHVPKIPDKDVVAS
jgi:hypothetical protein